MAARPARGGNGSSAVVGCCCRRNFLMARRARRIKNRTHTDDSAPLQRAPRAFPNIKSACTLRLGSEFRHHATAYAAPAVTERCRPLRGNSRSVLVTPCGKVTTSLVRSVTVRRAFFVVGTTIKPMILGGFPVFHLSGDAASFPISKIEKKRTRLWNSTGYIISVMSLFV